MDKIKLTTTEVKSHEGSKFRTYDVVVSLNNVVFPYNIFNGLNVVVASRYNFAEFDLFTCTCGESGCAGFNTKIIQSKSGDKVKWVFPNDESYQVEKLEYEFDKKEFEEEFQQLYNKMLKLEKEELYFVTSLSPKYSEDEDNTEIFSLESTLTEGFQWYINHYENEKMFYDFLKKTFPDLYKKSFYFKYDSKVGSYYTNFKDLIFGIMNEIPNNHENYLTKVKKAGEAVENLVYNGNATSFFDMLHTAYGKFSKDPNVKNDGENIWSRFSDKLDEIINKEEFNPEKLKLITT